MEIIKGILNKIKYFKDDYLIAMLSDKVSVKGKMYNPQVGMEYSFSGTWSTHPVWGPSFSFSDYEAYYPNNKNAIALYLREFKWIGSETAKLLIERYGDETLDICKTNPEQIANEIKYLTLERAEQLSLMLLKNEEEESLRIKLNEITEGSGIAKSKVNEIIEEYIKTEKKWQKVIDKINKNPYQLIDDFKGVGFLTADKIAKNTGVNKTNKNRIKQGLFYVLNENVSSKGHTCLPFKMLLNETSKLLDVSTETIKGVVNELVETKKLINFDGYIYIAYYFGIECYVGLKIRKLLSMAVDKVSVEIDTEGLYEDQIKALEKVSSNKVFILTGAPGTGKTFVIEKILEMFADLSVLLIAPTGKAAKRMQEQTKRTALTIHRALEPEWDIGDFVFSRNEINPLDEDVIIVDEMSMVDIDIMSSLLKAVKKESRLIMVGDHYQLPSVGPGNVLKDLLNAQIPSHELTIIKRQDAGLIIRNCHSIKNGENIVLENSTSEDFFFFQRNTEDEILSLVIDLFDRLSSKYDLHPLKDIQILTPFKERTKLSCQSFNEMCQSLINKTSTQHNFKLKEGDKVIQTKNDYKNNIYNGDVGFVERIEDKNKKIIVLFDNPKREVALDIMRNNLMLAYAITIHKSQGSEWPVIIIPIHKSFGGFMMNRNLLYTAISRAKQICVLVGHREEVGK